MTSAPQDVLDFWFARGNAARWFARDATFDAAIRARFGDTLAAAACGQLDGWADMPAGWLALLIVIDQFSRNFYRGGPQAWACDARAQALATAGIERRMDAALPPLQRVFAYLPLEHAEDFALQRHSVTLFRALVAQASAAERDSFESYLDYAQRHCEVIARYGRFPHRNAALGRISTAYEEAYLAQPDAGF